MAYPAGSPGAARRDHWDGVYSSRGEQQVSWHQANPRLSMRLIADAAAARTRPGSNRIAWVNADLLDWQPSRAHQIWHDRAVFHFLTDPADRAAYLAALRAALPGGGAIILATFAADGPEHCSGLPVARYDPNGLAAVLTSAYGDAITITGHHAEQHRTPAGAIQPFTWITARLS